MSEIKISLDFIQFFDKYFGQTKIAHFYHKQLFVFYITLYLVRISALGLDKIVSRFWHYLDFVALLYNQLAHPASSSPGGIRENSWEEAKEAKTLETKLIVGLLVCVNVQLWNEKQG